MHMEPEEKEVEDQYMEHELHEIPIPDKCSECFKQQKFHRYPQYNSNEQTLVELEKFNNPLER